MKDSGMTCIIEKRAQTTNVNPADFIGPRMMGEKTDETASTACTDFNTDANTSIAFDGEKVNQILEEVLRKFKKDDLAVMN